MMSTIFRLLCGSQRNSPVHGTTEMTTHVEEPAHPTSISMLPEDLMSKHVLSFLEFREIVRLDSALNNRNLRKYFHASLDGTVLGGIVDVHHLNWCILRRCSAKTLRVSSDWESGTHLDHTLHFETLQVCTSAKVSESGLHRMLTTSHGFKTLDVQSFYGLSLRHISPLVVPLSLIEINASDNMYLREDVLIALVSRCPLLQVIKASGNRHNTKLLPLALAKHCHQLRDTYLFTSYERREEDNEQRSTGYCELFKSCRLLEVVHCSYDFILTNMQTLADYCQRLNSVSLTCTQIPSWEDTHTAQADAALTSLVQNNPLIHTLRLSDFNHFSDASLRAIATNLPNLHTFYLHNCKASLTGLSAIRASCRKLTTFEVCDPLHYALDDDVVRDYLPLSILTALHIYSTTLSEEQLVTLAQNNPAMTALIIFTTDSYFSNVQNIPALTSNSLCEALRCLTQLEMLYVEQHIYRNEPELYAVQLEDNVLYTLAQYCPSLTSVSISGHANLSNEAICVLSTLPLLRSFHASQCANLADSTVVAIAEGCPLLEDIDLSNCPHVSSVGINALARCCRRLTTVELLHCRGVQNSAIRNLIRRARHLQSLTIAQNPQLTFAAVAELPKHCPCMRDLYFFTNSIGLIRKPLVLEFYASYRNNSIFCGSQRASQVHSSLDEVIRREQHGDATSFSLLPEDLMRKQVLSFLELREIVRLDSALANHTLRKYLHTSITNTVLNGTIDFGHLNWCKARKCSAKTLRISSILENDFPYHFDVMSPFKILEVCTTAKLSEHALHRLLTAGDFKILNIQSFYCMRPHHLFPCEGDLSLLEINVSDNMNLREDVLIALVSRCPLLRSINATAGIHFTERLPVALSKHCPQLRKVALYTTSDFGEDSDEEDFVEEKSTGYCELFRSCQHLQVVDCGGDFSLTNMQTLADCCKELNSVSLRHWGIVRWEETHTARADAALIALVQNNAHIQSLRLCDFQCFNEASLCAVAQNLPALHTMYLDCRQASLPGLASIRANCTKLTSFEVFRYRQVTTDTATSYLPVCILKSLHIYSTTLSDAQLLTIAQTNPTITTLTNTSYISFQTNEQNLNVHTANALCEVVSCLPHLEKFYSQQYHSRGRLREYAVQLEDSVLYALAQYCPSLTSLSISGHAKLSNEAISALSTLPLLRELYAKSCANVLDSSIVAIAEGCPLLENIDFSNCPHITNVGINSLARYCRRLTNVALRRCRGIQNNEIQCLIRRARCLQSLSIARNPQLTFAAVEELPLYCPRMRDVYFFINVNSMPQKPLFLEFYGAYRRNKHYFDVVFGWSEEHKVLFRSIPWDD